MYNVKNQGKMILAALLAWVCVIGDIYESHLVLWLPVTPRKLW